MKRDFHHSAYENYESSFGSQADIEKYREHLVKKTEPIAKFLRERVSKISLLEIACGNGRLPITLQLYRALECAWGFDVSISRVEFGRRWLKDTGLANIRLEIQDALRPYESEQKFNTAAIITGAFGYFKAIESDGDERVLEYLTRNLSPNAGILLELYNHPREIELCKTMPDCTIRTWDKLPPEDPFKYNLHKLIWLDQEKVLEHHKIFISKRGEVDEGRYEALRIYSCREISALLTRYGFSKIEFYGDWDGMPHNDDLHENTIVWARRS